MAHRKTTQQHSRLEKKDIEAAAETRRKGEQQGNQKNPYSETQSTNFLLKVRQKNPLSNISSTSYPSGVTLTWVLLNKPLP